ncbi:MAG: hypothetical protein K9J17_15915 [Flavobacteriales bacterium]|nr:hypothetical protein [Flavobacteriales bacterium]
MKNAFLLLFISIWSNASFAQNLTVFKDAANKFEIGVPSDWKRGVPGNSTVEFLAVRQGTSELDVTREIMSVNILHWTETDLDAAFKKYLEEVGKSQDFKILKESDRTIGGRKYKSLLESHKNTATGLEMTHSVLFSNDNGTVLILTMETTSANYDEFKNLFSRIASSLKF